MKLHYFGFVYNPTNPKFYLYSLISSCSRSLPQTSFSSLSLQAVVLPHNLPSSPFLLVSQKPSSRIPKTFNQKKKRKKKIQSF